MGKHKVRHCDGSLTCIALASSPFAGYLNAFVCSIALVSSLEVVLAGMSDKCAVVAFHYI